MGFCCHFGHLNPMFQLLRSPCLMQKILLSWLVPPCSSPSLALKSQIESLSFSSKVIPNIIPVSFRNHYFSPCFNGKTSMFHPIFLRNNMKPTMFQLCSNYVPTMFQHCFIFQPCVNLEKPTMKQPMGFHPAWPGRRADTRPPQIADPLPWHPPTTPAWHLAPSGARGAQGTTG